MASPLPFDSKTRTLSIAVTSTASTSIAMPGQGGTVRIVNEGPNIAFVSIGTGVRTAVLPSAVTPAGSSTPVLASSDISLSIPSDAVLNVSAICRAAGTATLTIQVGEGI